MFILKLEFSWKSKQFLDMSSINKRPLIGITMDSKQANGPFEKSSYILKQEYCHAVAMAGGTPLLLPYVYESVHHYIDMIDGLLITGGGFDIDPKIYGAIEIHPSVKTNDQRTSFEWEVLQEAFKKDIAILGICGGHQLINVVMGGTLYQDIDEEVEGSLPHLDPEAGFRTGHNIFIHPDTLLHQILETTEYQVNTSHHQAVKTVQDPIVVGARATDGIIESIENPKMKFCLGLQWHPECLINKGDEKIFKTFIEAALS
jgi:putative glutamine amidotransferase